MRTFEVGDRVRFRDSETGPIEFGNITEVFPADKDFPNGGTYLVALDNGEELEAYWTELTKTG